MTQQLDPRTAATHPNPYPLYAELVATKPLYYDASLGLWVASSAEMVSAVLASPLCRVRPATEPVPTALLGSRAAEIFRQLVRMNDGADHCPFKRAVTATMASISADHAAAQSARWAEHLATKYLDGAPEQASAFAFDLSVYVLGSLLGISDEWLPEVALLMSDFVCCLAPASTAAQIEQGKQAAARLYDIVQGLVQTHSTGVLATLAHEATRQGRTDVGSVVANGIGLLAQAYEATAGLIGNTLLVLAAHAPLRATLRACPAALSSMIHEVLRYDAPIQNTRRFVAHTGVIAGQELPAGATILVLLAAANRDPQANRDPAVFDWQRTDRRVFTFGLGAHACPGDALAPVIARAGVAQLITRDRWPHLPPATRYRPSANTRVALLECRELGGS